MSIRIFTLVFSLFSISASAQNQNSVCPGSTITLTAPAENTFWFADSLFTSQIGSGETYTTPAIQNSTTVYSVAECELIRFRLDSISSLNSSTADHSDLTGDDRGGIAVTNEYVYVVGDDYTARYDLDLTVASGQQFPVRDGIFSDLATGKLYSLYSIAQSTDPSDYPVSFSFDAIISLNPDLSFGNDTIHLNVPIDMGQQNGQNGIFAGMGHLVIYSGNTNHFYAVNICSGKVNDLGFLADPELYGSENWADWGIAEKWNGTFSVVYRSFYGSNLVRRYLSGFSTEDVAAFSDLSDMASITWSPVNKRWYFHNESTTPVFGGGQETVGFAGGDHFTAFSNSQVEDYNVFTITVPQINLGNDTTICSGSDLTIEADPGFASYNWNGINSSNFYTASATGEIILEVTDINNCILRDTIFVEARSCSDISGIEEGGGFNVWPNPASEEVNIYPGMETINGLNFELTDVSGRIIQSEKWSDITLSTIKKINVSDLSNGVYFIRITAGKEDQVKKIVINN